LGVDPAVIVELSDRGDDVRSLRIMASQKLSRLLRDLASAVGTKAPVG
jgi:hypothetical protein